MNFYWIDDNSSREQASKGLENYFKKKGVRTSSKFINLTNLKSRDFEALLKKTAPDLIIVDHFLNNATDQILSRGSSVAEIIRQEWPECPIVGVTAASKEAKVTSISKESYEDLFSTEDRDEMFSAILSLALGFRQLRRVKVKSVNKLVELLDPPKDEVANIIKIIPLKHDLNNAPKISRWIRQVLLEKPGLLYDDLWAATILGIKREAFPKVADYFNSAKYSGIFENYNGPRWWKGQLLKELYQKLKLKEIKLPWYAGRELKGITKKDYSLCWVCSKPYPEIVAFTDSSSGNRHQMHVSCTETHPDNVPAPLFEEMRMMKDS